MRIGTFYGATTAFAKNLKKTTRLSGGITDIWKRFYNRLLWKPLIGTDRYNVRETELLRCVTFYLHTAFQS